MNASRLVAMAVLPLVAAPAAAQDQELRRLTRRCGSQIEWIQDTPPPRNESPKWQADPADRSKLWQEALDKAKASDRPILLYLYRIDGKQMYRAPCLDNYMMNAVFTDPDVVNIVNSRFVAIRLLSNATLPLAIKPPDPADRGTLEPALVFAGADGKIAHIVDRIRTFNADWVVSILREILRKLKSPAPKGDDPEALIASGEYERAKAVLSKKADAASKLLLATVLRRLRDGDGALAALKGIDTPDAAVERGLILFKQGKLDDAKKELDAAIAAKPGRLEEARFLRACIQFYSGDSAGAVERLRELAAANAESPWAWRGAAEFTDFKDTTPDGPLAHYFLDLFWHSDRAYAGLPINTTLPAESKELPQVAARAIRWMLLHQRANGSFDDTRYAFWDSPKILPNVRVAVTALAATALLQWRDADPERIDRAVAAAEKYILDDANLAVGENEESYAHSYRLLYLSQQVKRKSDAAAEHVKAMERIVDRLSKMTTKSGFWAHEYPNPFITAVVVQALGWARDAGIKSAEEVLKRGAASLLKSRGEGGAQPYGAGRPASSPKDCAGRIPMCEGAIAQGAEGRPADVGKALETYWKYYENQEKVRKCDFHTDGELAGFFFLHNMYHATEAIKLLPKRDQPKLLARFRDAIVKLPEFDGSFVDDHEIGKSYGTAMGLLILRNVASSD